MQWSALSEEKQKNELAQKEVRFIKTNIINKGRQLLAVRRIHISSGINGITATFQVAFTSTVMQAVKFIFKTEGKNELAQTEFRFIKTIIVIIRGGNYLSFFASISALHCSKRRQISRRPFQADQCSGVY